MYKMHHPKADIDRLYEKSKEGRRGLVQNAATHIAEIINTAEYLKTNCIEDQFLPTVRSHESNQPNMNSTIKTAAKTIEELSQSNEKRDAKQDGIKHTKPRLEETLKQKMENKAMHGQYIKSIARELTGDEDGLLWLSRGDLKAETESVIVAAQDHAILT
jgi:hypothetical protein